MSRKQYNRPIKTKPIPTTCRECGAPITAPKTVQRRMCRSCFRVHKAVSA